MQKILSSIRKRPVNIILMAAVVLLYFFNNAYIKSHTDGMVWRFSVSYFNDLLCPCFFLSYANLLLITCDRELTRFWQLLALGIAAGLVWEFVGPLIKKGSVTDYADLLCYAAGTVIYWAILRLSKKAGKKNAES